jgi:HSP20 family protein
MRVTLSTVSPLDRIFDDVMGTMLGTATSAKTFEPAVDVRSTDDEVLFLCDVPGFKSDDLEITIENHVLTIKGTRKFESREGEQVMLGRPYGTFSRSFQLPTPVDEDRLAADLECGVLTIRLPKHPTTKPKRITIGIGKDVNRREE